VSTTGTDSDKSRRRRRRRRRKEEGGRRKEGPQTLQIIEVW
jgi:hypothetical protein